MDNQSDTLFDSKDWTEWLILRCFAIFLACIDSSMPEWVEDIVKALILGANCEAIDVTSGESMPPERKVPRGTSLIV